MAHPKHRDIKGPLFFIQNTCALAFRKKPNNDCPRLHDSKIICPFMFNCSQNFLSLFFFTACQFKGERPGGKFVRLPEDAQVGTEVFQVVAYPRQHFNIQALDGVSSEKLEQ